MPARKYGEIGIHSTFIIMDLVEIQAGPGSDAVSLALTMTIGSTMIQLRAILVTGSCLGIH